MGTYSFMPLSQIEHLNFRIYTSDEIQSLSVMEVKTNESLNALGHYVPDGIYDLRMGPMSYDDDSCHTCRKNCKDCGGHCGYIVLPVAVYNPLFIDVLQGLLTKVCIKCYRYQVKAGRALQFLFEMKIFDEGFVTSTLDLNSSLIDGGSYDHSSDGVSDVSKSYSGAVNPLQLERLLREKLLTLRKTKQHEGEFTNNSQAIYQKLQRKFASDTSKKKNCEYCKLSLVKVKIQHSRINIKSKDKDLSSDSENAFSDDDGDGYIKKRKKTKKSGVVSSGVKKTNMSEQSYLTPEQAQVILQCCWKNDGNLIGAIYPFLKFYKTMEHPTDIFFLKNLLVVPPKFRPLKKLGGLVMQHELSTVYEKILSLCKAMSFLVNYIDKDLADMPGEIKLIVDEFRGATITEKTHTIWHQMQSHVDNIFDADINVMAKVAGKGIRQIIEKKQGLLRQNLMGKRVNFTARSVVAPDPMLGMDEVGVPYQFALKLTYRTPVTQWNVNTLREMVINGPLEHPGAVSVEDEEGKKVQLSPVDRSQRVAIANKLMTPMESCVKMVNPSKVVYRHLQNGDFVLMNRQPTLHKSSIQAHKSKIMKGERVLRMPYACCKAYNADFDGDEMNMHFPQGELGRSESKHIVSCQHQYLSAKDGSPLAGLIQDCVVASVMLTVRGKFFNKEDYFELISLALSGYPKSIKTVYPSIVKPNMLWSGKQIISTILLNLIPEGKPKPTFDFKTTVKLDMWKTQKERYAVPAADGMTESNFVMRHGELLSGIVDKCAIGSTSFGLTHVCYDLYGGAVSTAFMTAINRLCVAFLQREGHTISVKEFITPLKVAAKRRKRLRNLIKVAPAEVSKNLDVPVEELCDFTESLHMSKCGKDLSDVDAAYTRVLGPVTSNVTRDNERGLFRSHLDNHMLMMVDTGAKGSKVNMNQMASLFGSVAIDGKRMPISVTGKTLPSFKPYECDPRAGGYIATRFMTGMDCRSYFFLCIVGRDSLQHTAVKTANSGYMQRCLIKHLESIHIEYDMTARNGDGTVIQFEYGEDGLDVSKIPFLKSNSTLDVIVNNPMKIDKRLSQSKKVKEYKKNVKNCLKAFQLSAKHRNSPFLSFSQQYRENQTEGTSKLLLNGRSGQAIEAVKRWISMPHEERKIYGSDTKLPAPITAVYNASADFGVISEVLEDVIDNYYENYQKTAQPSAKTSLTKKETSNILYNKIMHSRVEPGEAVGALCAQALGEPLTQMTLNTFHFAGRDELNVTLGVPRMIEILKTASPNISTPIMEVPFKDGIQRSVAELIKKKLTPVPFAKVIESVKLTSSIKSTSLQMKQIDMEFNFLPYKEYKKIFMLSPAAILEFFETYFISRVLIDGIKNALKKTGTFCATSHKSNVRDDKRDEFEQVAKPGGGLSGFEEPADVSDDEEDRNACKGDTDGISAARAKIETEDYEDTHDDDVQEKVDVDDMTSYGAENVDDPGVKYEDDEEEGEGEEEADSEKKAAPVFKRARRSKTPGASGASGGISDYEQRLNAVLLLDQFICDYSFEPEKQQWCKLSLALPLHMVQIDVVGILRLEINRTNVHHVRGIKKAHIVDQKSGELLLRTEGVNMRKMFEFRNVLNIDNLYTNNIHTMAETYGIEAAQRSVIKEIRSVNEAYDIKIDFRHLSLLSDYFTCEGSYKACSRHALRTCASPIQKLTYETACAFLKDALVQGHGDNLDSPSANVMVGQTVKVGTNAFDVLTRVKMPA